MTELHLDFGPVLGIAFSVLHFLMPLPDEWDLAGYILLVISSALIYYFVRKVKNLIR